MPVRTTTSKRPVSPPKHAPVSAAPPNPAAPAAPAQLSAAGAHDGTSSYTTAATNPYSEGGTRVTKNESASIAKASLGSGENLEKPGKK